ncbi:HEXXH motif-containing putative peptide modification protein [Nonomuraea sp. NPDC049421]|uniref:aKG-HExxH-type peptide beta-hydroxylase n=1 Tax=Nonomuraea sp. NPDC049421 TaxID=3155275 RepID=UPI003435BF5F
MTLWQEVERLLGTDPEYGDAAAIERRVLGRLRVGLTLLAELTPHNAEPVRRCAAAPDADLRVLSRDPVLRSAFESDLQTVTTQDLQTVTTQDLQTVTTQDLQTVTTQADTGLLLPGLLPADAGYAVSRAAAGGYAVSRAAAGGYAVSRAAAGGYAVSRAAGESPRSAWAWTETTRSTKDPVTARLWSLLDEQFPRGTADVPIKPSAAELKMIDEAAALLTALMPSVGPGVLANVGMIGLARDEGEDGPLHSVSGGDRFPATVFIAPEKLQNVWDAAGALLHEALHLALFEIIRCGAVVFDHVDATADVVPIPWRREAWSLMRVLFALHVYVHLAVYHGLARSAGPEITSRFGEPPADAAVSRATFGGARYATPELRARHLAEQLAQRSGLFTGYGHQLIAWLVKALDLLAPPTPGGGDGTTYQAVAPVAAVPLPEQRRLVVALADPPRVRWLNPAAWLVYRLCDGRDSAAISKEYAESVAGVVPPAEALRQAGTALRALVDDGLVVTA